MAHAEDTSGCCKWYRSVLHRRPWNVWKPGPVKCGRGSKRAQCMNEKNLEDHKKYKIDPCVEIDRAIT